MSTAQQRRTAHPVRVTLAPALGDDLDGAWWPRTASIARELPDLIETLHDALGQAVDIEVNWSSSDAMPSLELLTGRRGVTVLPQWRNCEQRVMTVIGSRARANLLVVPSLTPPGLATMVLRHAAALPIQTRHYENPAYLAAYDIVQAARAQCARSR